MPGKSSILTAAAGFVATVKQGLDGLVAFVQSYTGQIYANAKVLTHGPGTDRAWATNPLDADTEDPSKSSLASDVVVINTELGPLVIGSLGPPGSANIVDTKDEIANSADHSGEVTPHDFAWYVQNSAKVIIDDYGVSFIMSEGRPVRIQTTRLRVSSGGDSADRAALAAPTHGYLETLQQKIDEMGAAMVTIATAAGTTYTHTSPGEPPPIASAVVTLPSDVESS